MWAGIGVALQMILMVVKWFVGLDAEKKAKIDAIKEEITHAKSTSDITKLFDDINNL